MKDKISYLGSQEPCWAGFAHIWPPNLTQAFFSWDQFPSACSVLTSCLLPIRTGLYSNGSCSKRLHRSSCLRSVPLIPISIVLRCSQFLHDLWACCLLAYYLSLDTKMRSSPHPDFPVHRKGLAHRPFSTNVFGWLTPHLKFSWGKLKSYFIL